MDTDSCRRSVLFLVLLFLLSAFFSFTETAVSSVSRNKMKVKAEHNDPRAKRVLKILDSFDDAITTLLIFNNIVNIGAASIATVMVTRLWGVTWVTLSTFVVTIALFLLGEMLPKSLGRKNCEGGILTVSGILLVLMKIGTPFTKILTAIGHIGDSKKTADEEVSVTEDELYDIIEDMAEEGEITEEQSDIISSAISFGDVTCGSILTPRVDVAGIDINDTPEENLEIIKKANHSRILVYDKTIDHVIGVLRIRRYLKAYIEHKNIPNLRKMLDPVYYAHPTMEIDELLEVMSKKKLNMAVVTDSYGGTMGVVTIEDILEEIVGEIWDEDDVVKEPLMKIGDSSYLADGNETVADLLDFIGVEAKDESEEERFTNLLIADWVFENFTEIPRKKDSFFYQDCKVIIEGMKDRRILKVKVIKEKTKEERR